MILPELEQQALSNHIKFEIAHAPVRPVDGPDGSPGRLPLPGRCDVPDLDGDHGETWLYMGKVYSATDPICDVAGSNYVGVFGIGEPGVDGDGVFYRGSFTRFTDITDGLTPDPVRGRTVDEPEPGTRPGHLDRRGARRRLSGRAPPTRSTPTAARASARMVRA